MANLIKVYVYKVTDAEGTECFGVVQDPSDALCVYGYDYEHTYHQFDSTEAYHVYSWAEKHGFKVEMKIKEIEY